jgi:hypothetical protein
MLTDKAAEILKTGWDAVCSNAKAGKLRDSLSEPRLTKAIHLSVNSSTKTYRYFLPTQIVSKLADHTLDCHCLQAGRGGRGAFDARTVAHEVVVPFDQRVESVLGGSQEPYVNNPLRVPEVSRRYRDAQKNKPGWDKLCMVLDAVEHRSERAFTANVFRQVLTEIYKRLSAVRVVYPAPRRVSLHRAMEAVHQFLSEHSGGDRLLALSSALFSVIGERFRLYSEVRRGKITAADQQSGMLADLECVDKEGRIVFAVEVKDRKITVAQLKAKVRTVREKEVSEIFFVATQGTVASEEPALKSLVEREFASGQNVYVTNLDRLAQTALALVGEKGRRNFLIKTSKQLEEHRSDIVHRQTWSSILGKL